MSFNSSYPSQRQAQIKEMQGMFDQLLQSGSQRKKKPIFISRNKGSILQHEGLLGFRLQLKKLSVDNCRSKDKLDMTRSMFENFLKKDQEEHVHEVEESIKSIKENTVRQKESDEELRKMFEIWCELLEEKENEMAHIRKQLDDKEVQSNNLLKQLEIIKKETSDKDVLISQFEVSSRKFRHSMSSVESQLEQCKLLEQKLRKSELTVTSLQQNLELLRKENTRLTFMDSQLRELQKDYKSQIQKNKEYEETLSRHKSRMRISKQREGKYQLSLSQVNDLKQTVVLLQEEKEQIKQKLLKSENDQGLLQITLMKMENIKSGISDLESKSKECLEEEKKRMKTELDKQTEFAQRNESELRFKIQQLETTCRERLERNKILYTENLHYKSECSQLKIKVTKLEKELILFVQAKGELETISNENAMLNKELLAVQNKIYRNSEAKHFSAQQKGNKVIKIKKMQSSNLSPMTETYKCMSDRLEWAKSEIRKLSTDNSRSVALVAKLQMENQKFTKQILNVKEENTTISSLSYHQEKKESENITEIKSELTRLNRELDHQNASNESLRETILQLKQEIEGYQQQEFQYTRQEGLINEQRVLLEQLEGKNNILQETINALKMETKNQRKYIKQLENASKQKDSNLLNMRNEYQALQMKLTDEIHLLKKNADIAEERMNLEMNNHLKENTELQRHLEHMTENFKNLQIKMEDERVSYRKNILNARETIENLEDVITKLKNKISVNETTMVKLQNEVLFEKKVNKSTQTNLNVGSQLQEERPNISRNSSNANRWQKTLPINKLPQRNVLEQTQNVNTSTKDTKQENITTMFMGSESVTSNHTAMNHETQIGINIGNKSMKVEQNDEALRLSACGRSLEESLKREKILEDSLALIQKEFKDREKLLIIEIKKLNASNISLKKEIEAMNEQTTESIRDAEMNRSKLEDMQKCQAKLTRLEVLLEENENHTTVMQNENAQLVKDLVALERIKDAVMLDKDQAVLSFNKAKQQLEQFNRTEQSLKKELSNTERRYIKEVNQLKAINNELENEIKQNKETKKQCKSVAKETRSESDKIAIKEFENQISKFKLKLSQQNEELQQMQKRQSACQKSLEESLEREKLLEDSLALIQKEFMDREKILIIEIKQLTASNISLKKEIEAMNEQTAESIRDAEMNRSKLEDMQKCQAKLTRLEVLLEENENHTTAMQNENAQLVKDLAALERIKDAVMLDKDQAVLSLNKAKQQLEQFNRTEQSLKTELSNTETRYINEVNQLKAINNELENEIKQNKETKEQCKSVAKETRPESDKIAIVEFQNQISKLKFELSQQNEELQQLQKGKESQLFRIVEMENANLKTQYSVCRSEVARLKDEIEKMITSSIKQKQDFGNQQKMLINEIKMLEEKIIDNRLNSTSVTKALICNENTDRRSDHLTDLEQRVKMLEKLQTTESNDQENIENVEESKYKLQEYVVRLINNVREMKVEHETELAHYKKAIEEYETRVSSYEALVTTYKKQVETYESDAVHQSNALDLFAKEKELREKQEKSKEIDESGLESSFLQQRISVLRSTSDISERDLSSHQEHLKKHKHKNCETCVQIAKEVKILRCENARLVEEKKLIETSTQKIHFVKNLTKSFYQPGIHISIEDSG